MITALEEKEKDTRSRSNTLPAILSDSSTSSVAVAVAETNAAKSAGGTPSHLSPVLGGWRGPVSESTITDQSNAPFNKDTSSDEDGEEGDPEGVRPFTIHGGPPLSPTLEDSMEDSLSYVRVHPPLPLNEDMVSDPDRGRRNYLKSLSSPTLPLPFGVESPHEESCSRESLDDNNSMSSSPGSKVIQNKLQSESLVNLYQEEEGEGEGDRSPQLEHTKQKKKKKWKFFKKRRSGVQKEVKFETKCERSQSDAPSGRERVNPLESEKEGGSLVKMRSISHDTFLDVNTGGRGRRNRIDRYTIYMQDYSIKLEEERKKLSPKREAGKEEEAGGPSISILGNDGVDRGSTDDDLNRGEDEDTPPAEMTPLTFKHSLFCNQLKYKLRSALQNIHTPLTLCPSILQLQEDHTHSNTRYQLILLIQHSLQHFRWRQDDMEVALLSEILRMVEPLPNEL